VEHCAAISAIAELLLNQSRKERTSKNRIARDATMTDLKEKNPCWVQTSNRKILPNHTRRFQLRKFILLIFATLSHLYIDNFRLPLHAALQLCQH